MDKQGVLKALKELREKSSPRNFKQSVDVIINLKDLDTKKVEGQIDYYLTLPKPTGKVAKICALVGAELFEQAKLHCDKTIQDEEFQRYDKKAIKKLAEEYTHFLAQASLMTQIAKYFGRTLGPRGKMPNPKAGAVIPPNANMQQVVARLRQITRINNKQQLNIKIMVGREDMKDEELTENIMAVYTNTASKLVQEYNNIKSVLLKFTMSKPVKVQ